MRILLVTLFLAGSWTALAQSYTSYLTGSSTDLLSNPEGGVCLMGGAGEQGEAMKWFLNRADGGDVLVLRASGSDGYNDYFYTDLGVSLNSVETIVCHSADCATETYIHDAIEQAEAIWFAGGDQWDYISYWRNTAIDSLINQGIEERNMVIGGTSAGMAIQGAYYFSAENGTVTSATALSNPYDTDLTVSNEAFLTNAYLQDVITDTHYDSPDRKGRHTTFLAVMMEEFGTVGKGIACDEYTAVCIDESGIARVYGAYPTYDDIAYFVQPNCDLMDMTPEDCSEGNPLNWNRGEAALKVYTVYGTNDGSNTFDLNDWKTGSGGEWAHWWVDAGTFNESAGTAPICALGLEESESTTRVYPNPSSGQISIEGLDPNTPIRIIDQQGKIVHVAKSTEAATKSLQLSHLAPGCYTIEVGDTDLIERLRLILQ